MGACIIQYNLTILYTICKQESVTLAKREASPCDNVICNSIIKFQE